MIYDRWGGKIYEEYNIIPNEPTAGWDGTIGGTPQPPGTYAFVAYIRFLDDKTIRYSGTVTLVR
jgi:hypothetical protein